MRFVMFYHSLVSDWNHGNAHFLRGVVSELMERGHSVEVLEPREGWSLRNLVAEHGRKPLRDFARAYPGFSSRPYVLEELDLKEVLEGADVAIVHEWSEPELVGRIGKCRRDMGSFMLLFHDTHHRAVTDPAAMRKFDLSGYDGVLAFGEVLRRLYLRRRWARAAFTWHEAADVRRFRPLVKRQQGDLVWIGNWGDDERTRELKEFLLEPAGALGLRAQVHGVRYPKEAKRALKAAGIKYAGWLANFRAPEVFARFAFTVHVPRRPYVKALPGIPTIRIFEALACGIPLICAPWEDAEGLFSPGEDFLVAQSGAAMRRHMRSLLHVPELRQRLSERGLATILARHTCAHRVDQLLGIVRGVAMERELPRAGKRTVGTAKRGGAGRRRGKGTAEAAFV